MDNLKHKRIFIKNYDNNIYFVKNDGKKYLTLIQMKCDNELKLSNNILLITSNDALIYKHFNISDAYNDYQTTFKLYKKNYIDNVTVIKNIDDVYIVTTQSNNNYINNLYHDYENSLFYKNHKKLTYKIYIKNCIASIIRHLDSTNYNTIKRRDEFYNLHLKNIFNHQIEIIKDDDDKELYQNYLIILKKYDKISVLNDCECPVCLLNVKQYTFYKCHHFLCSECNLNWSLKTCPICRSN